LLNLRLLLLEGSLLLLGTLGRETTCLISLARGPLFWRFVYRNVRCNSLCFWR
jgi:hypothetical protein